MAAGDGRVWILRGSLRATCSGGKTPPAIAGKSQRLGILGSPGQEPQFVKPRRPAASGVSLSAPQPLPDSHPPKLRHSYVR